MRASQKLRKGNAKTKNAAERERESKKHCGKGTRKQRTLRNADRGQETLLLQVKPADIVRHLQRKHTRCKSRLLAFVKYQLFHKPVMTQKGNFKKQKK